jgi:GNAT superfamily N-acetyltransferase
MISELSTFHLRTILEIINSAAVVYKGVIPDDRWKEPFMSAKELKEEIADGVKFFGWIIESAIVGVMGIQQVKHITLIRHAYVTPKLQNKGVGTKLLKYLIGLTKTSEVLVGTWKAASWAICFYEKHGFELVSKKEKNDLLGRYWKIPDRQIETSVVLKLNRK